MAPGCGLDTPGKHKVAGRLHYIYLRRLLKLSVQGSDKRQNISGDGIWVALNVEYFQMTLFETQGSKDLE